MYDTPRPADCEDLPRATSRWHGAYCRWYDHREAGHRVRAALWGWYADRIVRWA